MSNHSEYVYVEQIEYDDGDDLGERTVVCFDSGERQSILSWSIDMSGCPEGWQDRLKTLKEGHYLVTYTSRTFQEGDWEHGYYDCAEVDELVSIKRSYLRGPLVYFWKTKVLTSYDLACSVAVDLFRPVWGLEFDYGGAGTSVGRMWFPEALALRIYTTETYEQNAWGAGYKSKSLRRR